MVRNSRQRLSWRLSWLRLLLPISWVLGGCQGTEWGTSLGKSLAPPSSTQVVNQGVNQVDRIVELPPSFPQELPIYPSARLVNALATTQGSFGAVRWQVSAPAQQVWQFYRELAGELGANGQTPLVLTRNLRKITLTVEAVNGNQSELFMQYQPLDLPKSATSETPKTIPQSPSLPSKSPLQDLDTAPPLLQPFLKDLDRLGLLDALEPGTFAPNRPISRRIFARWLFRINNFFYRDRRSRQVREALPDQPASFIDLGNSDPDFAIIQGLANGGLISGVDQKLANRFAPGSTISREQALIWKVPFDYSQLAGGVSPAMVQKAWGFSDQDRLSPKGLQVVLADAQGGDLANIRRAFGFIRRLQPTKPLTRAEAAAILWHFGGASDGINAQTVIRQQP